MQAQKQLRQLLKNEEVRASEVGAAYIEASIYYLLLVVQIKPTSLIHHQWYKKFIIVH